MHRFPAGGPVLLYFSLFFPALEISLTCACKIMSVTAAQSRTWAQAGAAGFSRRKSSSFNFSSLFSFRVCDVTGCKANRILFSTKSGLECEPEKALEAQLPPETEIKVTGQGKVSFCRHPYNSQVAEIHRDCVTSQKRKFITGVLLDPWTLPPWWEHMSRAGNSHNRDLLTWGECTVPALAWSKMVVQKERKKCNVSR